MNILANNKYVLSNSESVPGPKNPFLCPRGRVALSCGRVAHEGTHPVVLSHSDLNITTVESSGGSMIGEGTVGVIAAPQSESGL